MESAFRIRVEGTRRGEPWRSGVIWLVAPSRDLALVLAGMSALLQDVSPERVRIEEIIEPERA